jgi:hypothetical protein
LWRVQAVQLRHALADSDQRINSARIGLSGIESQSVTVKASLDPVKVQIILSRKP